MRVRSSHQLDKIFHQNQHITDTVANPTQGARSATPSLKNRYSNGFSRSKNLKTLPRKSMGDRDREQNKCRICSKEFYKKSTLYEHLDTHERSKNLKTLPRKSMGDRDREQNKCRICSKEFYKKSTLYEHLDTHELIFKCNKCFKTFYRRSIFQDHIKTHSERPRYPYDKNSREFPQKQHPSNWRSHSKPPLRDGRYHDSKYVPGNRDSKHDREKYAVGNHDKKYDREKYTRRFSQYGIFSKNNFNSTKSRSRREQECSQRKGNVSPSAQYSHRVSPTRPRSAQIPDFQQYQKMLNYQNLHQNFERYSHFRSGNLKLKSKTEIKPYSCDQCPQEFYKSFELINHMTIHIGKSPEKVVDAFQEMSAKKLVSEKIDIVDLEEMDASESASEKDNFNFEKLAENEEIIDFEEMAERELNELNWYNDNILEEFKEKNMKILNGLNNICEEIMNESDSYANKIVGRPDHTNKCDKNNMDTPKCDEGFSLQVKNENNGKELTPDLEKVLKIGSKPHRDILINSHNIEQVNGKELKELNWFDGKVLDEFKEKNMNTFNELHYISEEIINASDHRNNRDFVEKKIIDSKSDNNSMDPLKCDEVVGVPHISEDIPDTVSIPEIIKEMERQKQEIIRINQITEDDDEELACAWLGEFFSELSKNSNELDCDEVITLNMLKSANTVTLPEITPKMEYLIKTALKPRQEILINSHNIEIGWKDIHKLDGLNWLNDKIINFYLQMIVERGVRTGVKIYAANTFFYPKMMSGGQPSLKRWTRKVDIFSQDMMLIPIHLGIHWSLAVVDFRKPGVYYYDSMGGDNQGCIQAILKYLQNEYRYRKGGELDVSKFETRTVEGIPRQMNGSDCGVFACQFAEYISRGAELTFSQKDMPNFRKIMIWEIMKDTMLQR